MNGGWHIALAALVVVLSVAPAALAQLSVTPNIVEAGVYPGSTARFEVGITNRTKKNQQVEVSISALEIAAGGMPVAAENAPRSAQGWIEISPTTFTLAPDESRSVTANLRAPADTAGGYYAMLLLDGNPVDDAEDSAGDEGVRAGVRFRYRTMVPVLLTVPGPDLRAEIQAGEPEMWVQKDRQGYTLKIPLRNNGNMHARIVGTAAIESENGQNLETFELSAGSGFLLPDQVRKYSSKGVVNLPDGVYVARLEVKLEGSPTPMKNAFPFYVEDGIPELQEVTDELRERLIEQSVGFTVSPPEINMAMRAGAQRTEVLELKNTTGHELPVSARLAQWYRSPEGLDLVADDPPPHGLSAVGALSVLPTDLVLPPRGRARVTVRAHIPRGAAGEAYAAVVFDPVPPRENESPRSRTRHSCLVRLSSEQTQAPAAEVEAFEAHLKDSGAVELTTRLRNTGNVAISPEPDISIRDQDNVEVDRIRQSEAPPFMQAGSEMVLHNICEKLLAPGDYTAVLNVRADPDKPPLSARAPFKVPVRVSAPAEGG